MNGLRATASNRRLAEIRAKLLLFSSQVDTSTWEATFFLKLLEEKNREIRRLKASRTALQRAFRKPNVP